MVPETRYTQVHDRQVAYQVVGDGPIDVIVTNPAYLPIDLRWDEPSPVRFLDGLSSFSRCIWADLCAHWGDRAEHDDVGGTAVHIAQRVMAGAQPGEIVVSSTVRDLVAGSAIEFQDRGLRELRFGDSRMVSGEVASKLHSRGPFQACLYLV